MQQAPESQSASVGWRSLKSFAATLALSAAAAGQAATTTITFDTDTASNAQTLALYGLAVDGGTGLATNGHFELQITNVNRVTADVGSFAGNVRLDVDLVFTGLAGSMGIGFRIGDNYLVFHPGYAGGAFRVDGPGGTSNTDMGFTPTQGAMSHMTIAFDAAAARSSITIIDGLDAAKRFNTSFQHTTYSAGSSLFGLEVNGQGKGSFDNLTITTPVPEPAPAALWAMGVAAFALRAAAARRRMRGMRLRQRSAAGFALTVFACAGVAVPLDAGASAVYLYEESVSGDLGPSTFYGGTPPIFTLGPNSGLIAGSLGAGINQFGQFTTDVDAFRFVVEAGYQLTAIEVTYLATATRGDVPLPFVQNVLFFSPDANDGSVAEYFQPLGSGTEGLFDITHPLQPIGHRSTPSQMVMQFAEPSGLRPDTGLSYSYILRFDVQPAAVASVAEPGSFALVAAALSWLPWIRRRQHVGTARC